MEGKRKAQAHEPSSFSKLPCDSAPIRGDGASCPALSRTQVIVPCTVGHLEQHLLKKHHENRSDLPVMVKKNHRKHLINRLPTVGSLRARDLLSIFMGGFHYPSAPGADGRTLKKTDSHTTEVNGPKKSSYLWTWVRQKLITGLHVPQHRQVKAVSIHRVSHQRGQRCYNHGGTHTRI